MTFKHILLIDDDEEDQEIFQDAIKTISSSIQYDYCNNAKDALHKLMADELKPEVIFLDLNMPMMNGHEFLTLIKKDEHLSTIPVIIFSTASNESIKQTVKELGAYDFITKPIEFNKLIELLKPFIS